MPTAWRQMSEEYGVRVMFSGNPGALGGAGHSGAAPCNPEPTCEVTVSLQDSGQVVQGGGGEGEFQSRVLVPNVRGVVMNGVFFLEPLPLADPSST